MTWRVLGPSREVLAAYTGAGAKNSAEAECEHLVEVHGWDRAELEVTDQEPEA